MAFDDENRDKTTDSHGEETELEQYGVWVKIGPEEISAEEEDTIEDDFGLHDLTHDGDKTVASELTDEEEQLLGELEQNIDDMDIDLDEEDFGEGDTTAEESSGSGAAVEHITTEVEDIDIDDLEELPDNSEDGEIELEEDFSPAQDIPVSDQDSGASKVEPSEEVSDLDMAEPEDDSLDEELDLDIDEDLLLGADDLDDLDDLDVESLVEEDLDELGPDFEGAEDIEESVEVEKGSVDDLALEEEIEDLDLAELGGVSEEAQLTEDDSSFSETDDLEDFDDLEALETDLGDDSELLDLQEEPESTAPDSGSQSVEVLSKIEHELLSIKNELSSLKEELSSLRASKASRDGLESLGEAAVHAGDEDEEEMEDSGFFDEDEDEIIALTGDELDNILNTADFTEENGTEEIIPEDSDEEVVDFSEGFSLEETETEEGDTPTSENEEEIDFEGEIPDLPANQDFTEEAEEDFPEPMTPDEERMLLDQADILDIELDEEEELDISSEEESSELEVPGEEEADELQSLESLSEEIPAVKEEELEDEIDLEELEDLPSEESGESEELEEFDMDDLDLMNEPEEEEAEITALDEQDSETAENVQEEELDELDIDESEIVSLEIDDIETEKTPEDEPEELLSEKDISTEEDLSFDEDILDELEIEIPEETDGDDVLDSVQEEEESPEEILEDLGEAVEEESEAVDIVQDEEEVLFDDEEAIVGENSAPEVTPISAQSSVNPQRPRTEEIPEGLKSEIKSVLSYMDQLLESLPEEKIQEFANSDHFDVYKRLFDELGLNA